MALRQASGAVLRASRANGTYDGYITALGHWFAYCLDAGIPLAPACDGHDDDRLLGFALYLTLGTALTGDTVATYCASVSQYFAVHLNTPMRTKESFQLAAVIRAAKRTKLSNVPTRHALTVDELFAMLDVQRVRSSGDDVDGLRDYAMLLTAYFGLARVGEYTSHTGITRGAVQFVDAADDRPEHVILSLYGSKTDPFSKGQRIVIGATSARHCPVTALRKFFAATDYMADSEPLFSTRPRVVVSSRHVNNLIKSLGAAVGVPTRGLSSHSMRHGFATELLTATGSARDIVLEAGRWSPNSVAASAYFHAAGRRLCGLAQMVAQRARAL
jgi:site-specific recombinase XerD